MPAAAAPETTSPIRKILVATDFGEQGDFAIREAASWARRHDAELVLLHVLPSALGEHVPFADLLPNPSGQTVEELEQRARDALEQKALRATEKHFHIRIESGEPHAVIVRTADAERADLVIVGSRGPRGLERLGLGSTALQVVRYAQCPVLVARKSPHSAEVIAATDLSEGALSALTLAAIEARSRNATLLVVHAIEPAALGEMPGLSQAAHVAPSPNVAAAMEEARAEAVSEARGQVLALLDKLAVSGEVEVITGPAPRALLEFVETRTPELVVVGTHGRTGLRRLALGSVAEEIVRLSASPVLVTRVR